MARTILSIIFLSLLSVQITAQNNDSPLEIFQKPNDNGGFTYYAENKDLAPYQLQVDFTELTNLTPSKPIPHFQVIYPGPAQKLFDLKPGGGRNSAFKSRYQMAMGDPHAQVDMNFPYWLPYEHGATHMLNQGPNGSYTHQGKHAFDFVMDEGTPVCASRGGLVVAVKEDGRIGGPDAKFMEHANRITILHEDGSYADYAHLRYQGSRVNPGDEVVAGQVIGYSGNTGWSTRPHLHFQVYKAVKFGIQTLPTRFVIAPNVVADIKEFKSYRGVHKR